MSVPLPSPTLSAFTRNVTQAPNEEPEMVARFMKQFIEPFFRWQASRELMSYIRQKERVNYLASNNEAVGSKSAELAKIASA